MATAQPTVSTRSASTKHMVVAGAEPETQAIRTRARTPSSSHQYLQSARIDEYDPKSSGQRKGYVQVMRAQRLFHEPNLNPHQLRKAQQIDGRVALSIRNLAKNVDVVVVGGNSEVVALATVFPTFGPNGPEVKIEDLAVIKDARRRRFGTRLLYKIFIVAANQGATAVTWDMLRNNYKAAGLYNKVAPGFNAQIPHDLWTIKEETVSKIADSKKASAELAAYSDLDALCKMGLAGYEVHLNYTSTKLIVQDQDRNQANDFIVYENGSSAWVSANYTTWQAKKRADVNLYLDREYTETDVAKLIKRVANEVTHRHSWHGADIQLRVSNNYLETELTRPSADLDKPQTPDIGALEKEKHRIQPALSVFEEMGAVVLSHGASCMIGCRVDGPAFVRAALEAAKNSPDQTLDKDVRDSLLKRKKAYRDRKYFAA